MRNLTVGKIIALFLLLGGLCSPGGAEDRPVRVGRGLPISLPNLVKFSDRIFVGQVVSLRKKRWRESEDKPADLEVQAVTFRIREGLRGDFDAGDEITVHQALSIRSPVEEGDRVLWFLAPENSLGLSVPLGYHSGHFRVFENGDRREWYGMNLNHNSLLWSPSVSLWESSPDCSEERFEDAMEDREVPERAREYFRRLASRAYRAKPLPLEFLVSLVEACLPDRKAVPPTMPLSL